MYGNKGVHFGYRLVRSILDLQISQASDEFQVT